MNSKGFIFHSNDEDVCIFNAELSQTSLIQSFITDYEIEVVIHLACNMVPASTYDDFDNEISSIILPTYKLIDFLSETRIQLIFFSSGGAIYGNIKKNKINEDALLNPISLYGYSKLMIETYITYKSKTTNLNYIILRPSNIFGKHPKKFTNQGLIPIVIERILNNKEITIWGNGTNVRDYIYVDNISKVVSKILEFNISNQIFNIGSGVGYSQLEIINILERELNRKAKLIFENPRMVDINRVVLDINKLYNKLDFKPTNSKVDIRLYANELKKDINKISTLF
jgi:UDP-glucose 4-epimerase